MGEKEVAVHDSCISLGYQLQAIFKNGGKNLPNLNRRGVLKNWVAHRIGKTQRTRFGNGKNKRKPWQPESQAKSHFSLVSPQNMDAPGLHH